MINKTRLVGLLQGLIRINSENPPGDESRIAGFVKDYLVKLGLKAKIYEFKKRRSNVVALLEAKERPHSLLITPHLDTVPAGKNWQMGPFSGIVRKGRIYGLGATDCKVNLACALEAINSLIEDKAFLDYRLIFAATADEECGSNLGLIPLLDKKILRPDMAVVLDSDDFSIIITQKGLMHLKVKIQGQRAHGAYPQRGINAIDIAIELIRKIKAYKFGNQKNRYLNPPTVNIGTIKGGDKVNVVADWCEFELDFRFLPGTNVKDLLGAIKDILKRQIKKFYPCRIKPLDALKLEIEGIQEPYFINPAHPLVERLKKAMLETGIKPRIQGSEGATVITFFQHKNIPAIATGFGKEGCAHSANEYVGINNLYKGAMVLEEFLKSYKFE